MGKSSILRNLDQMAPEAVIACLDMAGETATVASIANLLYTLADGLQAALACALPQAALPPPNEADYAMTIRQKSVSRASCGARVKYWEPEPDSGVG